MIDAESNAAAYECTAKRLARFEREGFVLGGVIAAALRRGIEEERDGERLGDEESEPAARGASRRAAKKKKSLARRTRVAEHTEIAGSRARIGAVDRAEDEEDEKTNGRHSNDM